MLISKQTPLTHTSPPFSSHHLLVQNGRQRFYTSELNLISNRHYFYESRNLIAYSRSVTCFRVNKTSQNNGLECMAELIDHCSSNQLIRFEVVGVIAMVTSPQMAVDQDIQSLIPYLDIIVCNIIGQCFKFSSNYKSFLILIKFYHSFKCIIFKFISLILNF